MATRVGDLRLVARFDEGTGPVIVLLHGINSDASSWRTVVDEIGDGYRVIAFDLLGFGLSPKPTDIDYTADDHAEVLAATLGDLGVTERFVLVGYSMGGNVAIRYAARYPDTLRRLLLLSAPFYLPAEAYSRKAFGWHYAQARFFQWLWRVIGRQKERDTLAFGVLSGPLERQMSDFMRTDDLSGHWDIMAKNLTNTIQAATFVDDLRHLTMPTVFALGIRDPIVRPDQTMALRRVLPTLEVRRIVGLSADHMLLTKAPAQVAHEILADEVSGLHVRRRVGAGEPVVLLPGLADDGRGWQAVARALADDDHEVAVVDLLGFGESPRPLSSHYTLADHAAAVQMTVASLFGDAPVTLVGHGFGATVALAVAASDPGRVASVVGFSPVLVAPGASGAGQRADPTVATVLALRETYADFARDERALRVSGERIEGEIVPTLRSIDAILETDAAALLDRQTRPVRLVVPREDTFAPAEWLGRAARQGVEVVEVDGDETFTYRHPDAAAAAIAGDDDSWVPAVRAASVREAVSERVGAREADSLVVNPGEGVRRLLGGANAQLIRHGVIALLGGLALLLAPVEIPVRVVATAFAGWLLVEAIQTVAGAVGLKRHGGSWIGWLLIGLVSMPFAALLAAGDAFAVGVLIAVVAGWALVRAATALFSAWRAPSLPGRRWGLVAEGVLLLALGVTLLAVPDTGGRLLRWALGAYLAASGAVSLGMAYGAHRRTVERFRRYVGAAASGVGARRY